jgi:hypothetical protein
MFIAEVGISICDDCAAALAKIKQLVAAASAIWLGYGGWAQFWIYKIKLGFYIFIVY